MTPELLLREEAKIENELHRIAREEGALHDPVTDGTVDPATYVSSSPKILWILKEPWEELAEGESGGGWSLTKDVARQPLQKNRGALTMIAYITFSVFNGCIPYDGMDYPSENSAIGESLRKISIINVKKYPGGKSSINTEISAAFDKNKAILLQQIEMLQPDIVIGGNTLQYFFGALGLEEEAFSSSGSARFLVKDDRLYIRAAHPAQYQIPPYDYVTDIVMIIKEHLASRPAPLS